MNRFEKDYKKLLSTILHSGYEEENRTGVNTLVCFAESLKINLRDGFPIITGKKTFFDKGLAEFEWIVNGLTSIEFLKERGVNWWDNYAKDGYVVKSYGYQLRNYLNSFDQLDYVIKEIEKKSRRAHITMWNPLDLKHQALPCCYTGLTFVVIDNKLNLSIDFRSSDVFLGLPYDIIFGALMVYFICNITKLEVGYLNLSLANAHIYVNHINQVEDYLTKPIFDLPKIILDENKKYSIKNYESGVFIKAPLNGN